MLMSLNSEILKIEFSIKNESVRLMRLEFQLGEKLKMLDQTVQMSVSPASL